MTSKLCVVIPAYNASGTIESVIRGALKHVHKVFVVDDGSSDSTATTASGAGAEVIVINKNRGKGNALKVLFQKAIEAGYDAVISMDADGQHDPEEIPRFITAHAMYPDNIIIGSRMHKKEKIPRARYNSMHVARFYISLAANQFIEDTQCGFRLYPLSLIKKMRLTTERYVTETEILMKAGDSGSTIRCFPVKAIYGDNDSHFRPIMDVAAITAYVISYLHIKWFIEGVTSNKPCTYSQDNIRDKIGIYKPVDIFFQTVTVFTALPATVLFFLAYTLLSPIVNNYLTIRRLGCGFFKITIATQMLPLLLIVLILEKILKSIGVGFKPVDNIIQWAYPHLWLNTY
ncbi:MAG: glycosyltransferase family 2 protein [Nitrospirota bacterium]